MVKVGAPMDGTMAVQAGAGEESVVGAAAVETSAGIIRGTGVLGPVMAVLADIGNFFGQQFGVSAAMGRMTDKAVLLNRRMLPDKGASFFRMTLVTQLIDGIFLDHVLGGGAMGIVAVSAHDLVLDDGMMGLFVYRDFDFPVAGKTFGGLIHRATGGVHGMTVKTGNIVSAVLAHLPHGHVGVTVMTCQAFGAQFIDCAAPFCLVSQDVLHSGIGNVGIRIPVAGLAAVLFPHALPDLRMKRGVKAVDHLLMAIGTAFPGCCCQSSRGWQQPHAPPSGNRYGNTP